MKNGGIGPVKLKGGEVKRSVSSSSLMSTSLRGGRETMGAVGLPKGDLKRWIKCTALDPLPPRPTRAAAYPLIRILS